jgi:hypothetical protein
MQEQAAAAEAARKANVNRFVELWLTLGVDLLKVAGSNRHTAELQEAQGIAAARWNQLIGMEAQAEREAAALARRPKKRPAQPGDEVLPDRLLEKQEREWQEKTTYLHAALADLREQAKRERKELEALRTK